MRIKAHEFYINDESWEAVFTIKGQQHIQEGDSFIAIKAEGIWHFPFKSVLSLEERATFTQQLDFQFLEMMDRSNNRKAS